MAVLVATRFTVSSPRHLPGFLKGTVGAAWQARRSPGFLGGRLRFEPGSGAYWTLTVWESRQAVVAFRDTGMHAALVPRTARWAGEAAFGVWETASSRAPGWAEVSARVAEHPSFASLEHPAPAHQRRTVPPVRAVGFDLTIPRLRRDARRPSSA